MELKHDDAKKETKLGARHMPRLGLGAAVLAAGLAFLPSCATTGAANSPQLTDGRTDVQYIVGRFMGRPSDMDIENMAIRLSHLVQSRVSLDKLSTPGAQAQIEDIDKELASFKRWLAGLGITEEDPRTGLIKLKARLYTIQSLYSDSDPLHPKVLDFIADQSSNPALFLLYKEYLLEIDKRSANLFSDMSPEDPDFISNARKNMGMRINSLNALIGREIWQKDYFAKLYELVTSKQNGPTTQSSILWQQIQHVPLNAQMAMNASNPSPMTAAAFYEYQITATYNNLADEREKLLVAATAAKLLTLSPVLGPKYFIAIKNLGSNCEGNPGKFLNALSTIMARIDSQLSLSFSTDPLQFKYTQALTVISDGLDDVAKQSKCEPMP